MEKTNYEKAVDLISKAVKPTKIVSQENKTGTSFFEGKKRLCKVLVTKKSITLEINVNLPTETEKTYNLEKISAAKAHSKHLGTMKYFTTLTDEKTLPLLVKTMIDQFKIEKQVEAAKQN